MNCGFAGHPIGSDAAPIKMHCKLGLHTSLLLIFRDNKILLTINAKYPSPVR